MRPIDADDFRERMDMICDAGGYLQPITEAVREYVKIMIDRQPTVETEPDKGWISVKDRLPEPETWVMVYIEYPSPVLEIERGIQKTNSVKKLFYDGKDFYYDYGNITHWMPLPEPPKEDKDGTF